MPHTENNPVELLKIRTTDYYTRVRQAILTDEAITVLIHEKPRKAAERMRALAIMLNISAEALEKLSDLQKIQKATEDKQVADRVKEHKNAEAERDSSSS